MLTEPDPEAMTNDYTHLNVTIIIAGSSLPDFLQGKDEEELAIQMLNRVFEDFPKMFP